MSDTRKCPRCSSDLVPVSRYDAGVFVDGRTAKGRLRAGELHHWECQECGEDQQREDENDV